MKSLQNASIKQLVKSFKVTLGFQPLSVWDF